MPSHPFPLAALGLLTAAGLATANPPDPVPARDPYDAAVPNETLMTPEKDTVPVRFLTRNGNPAVWDKLPGFWSETTEEYADPVTGAKSPRKVVTIKVPLGLSQAPVSPAENPLTLAKWQLGKRLYFDKTLSSNGTVSCATCHDPARGWSDKAKTSLGINQQLGGMNAPTVVNSAYHALQFWDGRAASLEEQAQGPVGNPLEMFAGKGEPWEEAVARLRRSPEYVTAFLKVFGHLPTRDAAAKAIAAFERTVLSGNSLYDRAQVAMRKRASEEEVRPEIAAADYEAVLKAAVAAKDANALGAVGLTDAGRAAEFGKRLANGQVLFFGKARCSTCHAGDNFSDNLFHNLGVGVENGKLPDAALGRFTRLPTGHKDAGQVGAFKTPGLRALGDSGPYLHDGSEKTLEAVIDFYDRGGNANEFLSPKMRDLTAEANYLKARIAGTAAGLPKPPAFTRSGKPVIPFKLGLTPGEKADLVLFLKALQGDPIDPMVADPDRR